MQFMVEHCFGYWHRLVCRLKHAGMGIMLLSHIDLHINYYTQNNGFHTMAYMENHFDIAAFILEIKMIINYHIIAHCHFIDKFIDFIIVKSVDFRSSLSNHEKKYIYIKFILF